MATLTNRHSWRGSFRDALATAVLGAVLSAVLMVGGCSGKDKAVPRPRVVMPVVRDIPAPLRGTIGSEVTFRGIDPVLITGYGLVVGLNGTGGGILPEAIAGTMEREMALRGIARGGTAEGTGLTLPDGRGRTPAEVLRDKRVAVVVVYARVPPGAPRGMTFDVFVQAVNATSLQGGMLWTTDLQIGPSNPFGGIKKKLIAKAKGPLFTNPFVEPGVGGAGARTVGRVMGGGIMTEPLDIEMVLDNASHARARVITNAINTRFPEGVGDRAPPARGRNDSSVALTVPARYHRNAGDFIKMVQHLPIDPRIPGEEYARRYTEGLKTDPALWEDLMWCLQAVGPASITQLRSLYDYPELIPRMAALRAGAGLRDARAAEPLEDMATTGPTGRRAEATRMLGEIEGGIGIDLILHELVDDPELVVRIAAYESLAARAVRSRILYLLVRRERQLQVPGPPMTLYEVDLSARRWLPADNAQGIRRRPVDRKFVMDQIPSQKLMVYATQQGEARLVIFGGEEVRLQAPLLVSTWSDRLMLMSDSPQDPVRVYYKDYRTGRVIIQEVPYSIPQLIEFMAHTPTPEDPTPGLGLSYSEVVGALAAIADAGAMNAPLHTEQDRLLTELIEAQRAGIVADRPERPGEETTMPLTMPALRGADDQPPGEYRPRIIPVAPPSAPPDDQATNTSATGG